MAVEREEIMLELRAETAIAEQNVIKFQKRLDEQAKAATNASGQTAGAFQRINQTSKQLNIAEKHLASLQQRMVQTDQASRNAGRGATFFGQQLGYFISDVRFGPVAVGNNLSIMAVAFQQMQKEAREAGETVTGAFVKSLRGPVGALVAIQVLVALLPEIVEFFKNFGKGADEASKAVQELNKQTTDLAKKIEEENKVLKERVELIRDNLKGLQQLVGQGGTLAKSQAQY